uniref:CCHC-type domain-containing protein n=1 Tax=Leptobrachium leishanense TaxID=445787 RepID=A0A8C5ME95_9ANUR
MRTGSGPAAGRSPSSCARSGGGVAQHLPTSFFIGADRITCFYTGQPRVCFKCGSPRHFSNACEVLRCTLCGAVGHLRDRCGHIWCNLCGELGHAYRSCPYAAHNLEELWQDEPREMPPPGSAMLREVGQWAQDPLPRALPGSRRPPILDPLARRQRPGDLPPRTPRLLIPGPRPQPPGESSLGLGALSLPPARRQFIPLGNRWTPVNPPPEVPRSVRSPVRKGRDLQRYPDIQASTLVNPHPLPRYRPPPLPLRSAGPCRFQHPPMPWGSSLSLPPLWRTPFQHPTAIPSCRVLCGLT